MKELFLSKSNIKKIKQEDSIFGSNLDKSLNSFKNILKQAPSYTKNIIDSIKPDEIYQAVIPRDVNEKLSRGIYEKMNISESGLWNGLIRKKGGNKKIIKHTQFKKIPRDPSKFIENLNQISLQAEVTEITNQISKLDKKIDTLLTGQHTDRISEIESGIDIYRQIQSIDDIPNRKIKLGTALGQLSSGRRKLMNNMKNIFNKKVNEKSFMDKIWSLIGIDKNEIEYYDYLQNHYDNIIDCMKYINKSTLYIMRIHSIENNSQGVLEAKNQYNDFLHLFGSSIDRINNYLPNEATNQINLINYKKPFKRVSNGIKRINNKKYELKVNLSYNEVVNELL